jgi:hypothetical protein
MYVDPTVVRRKVDRELQLFVERIDHYRARGIWILEYRFPELHVAFATPNLKPVALAPYGVVLELSNYDVEPPSIRFVNPFSRVPLKLAEIRTRLPKLKLLGDPKAPPVPPQVEVQELLQGWTPDDPSPFVCLQGVREYHENPGHTGDSWWFYRSKGAGGICRLLDLLARYGTESMRELRYQVRLDLQDIAHQSIAEWT